MIHQLIPSFALESLGTIDFVTKDNKLVYQTHKEDINNVVQLGVADATVALQAASVVYVIIQLFVLNLFLFAELTTSEQLI